MQSLTTTKHLHLASDRLALVIARDYPMISYLGVESGGRNRNHLDKNLLRPGVGGRLAGDRPRVGCPSRPWESEILDDGILYQSDEVDATFRMVNDRALKIRIEAKTGMIEGPIFRMAFAPDVTPPSLWARPISWERDRAPEYETLALPRTISRDFTMPGIVSLPDFGLLRLETSNPGVLITEEMVPDLANAGINHGWAHANSLCARKTYHLGEIAMLFRCETPGERVELHFTVADEIVPVVDGCDFAGAEWDGLRRCWMNAFTLNPPTLSLGDNPILHGLGHLAIHWKSDMSVLTPDLLPGVSLRHFLRNALETTFSEHTDKAGKVTGYGWENGGCNLIALHAYLIGTNDWEFARNQLPAVRRIVEYNLAKDSDYDGILEAAFHGNHNEETSKKESFNWWDVFAFGHKDGYANLIYHQACRRIRCVLELLGQSDLVDRIDGYLAMSKATFHSVFFNPKTGVYAGWISRDGRMHDYYFTFVTAMAVIEDLVPDRDTAQAMLQCLLDKLDQNGYGEFRFGVPGMAEPVDEADRITWAPMADWGNYIHGGFCGVVAYYFVLALYRAGMRAKADEILFKMLQSFETMPTHSGLHPGFGIGKSWDWRTRDGLPSGYNYLADNYVFLLAAIQGHFEVDLPSLEPPGS